MLKDSPMIHSSETQTPLAEARTRHQHCLYLGEIQMKAVPRKATLSCLPCVLRMGQGHDAPRTMLTPPPEWQEVDTVSTIYLKTGSGNDISYSSEPGI